MISIVKEGPSPTRQCPKCGQHKPATLEFFPGSKSCRLGLAYTCRSCRSADTKAWRSRTGRQKLTDDEVQDRAATAERKRRERICNTTGCENRLASETKGTRCPDCATTHWLRWASRNPEKYEMVLARRAASVAAQWSEQQKAAHRERAQAARRALRAEFLAAYGGACTCCGESEPAFLTLEHVRRDGKRHRQIVGGTYRQLADLRRRGWPKDGYTILCFNCNHARWIHQVCPHEIRPQSSELRAVP